MAWHGGYLSTFGTHAKRSPFINEGKEKRRRNEKRPFGLSSFFLILLTLSSILYPLQTHPQWQEQNGQTE